MAEKNKASIGDETSESENPGMKHNIPGRVYKDITKYAEKNNVVKVILFGSRARGTNTPRSDIDIAVQGGDFDNFHLELTENSHTLLFFDIVKYDNGVTMDLRNEIMRDGVIIYEKT